MGIWKEIRCDVNGPDCHSRDNMGPMGFDTASIIRQRARKVGWKWRDGKDVCPSCLGIKK